MAFSNESIIDSLNARSQEIQDQVRDLEEAIEVLTTALEVKRASRRELVSELRRISNAIAALDPTTKVMVDTKQVEKDLLAFAQSADHTAAPHHMVEVPNDNFDGLRITAEPGFTLTEDGRLIPNSLLTPPVNTSFAPASEPKQPRARTVVPKNLEQLVTENEVKDQADDIPF